MPRSFRKSVITLRMLWQNLNPSRDYLECEKGNLFLLKDRTFILNRVLDEIISDEDFSFLLD